MLRKISSQRGSASILGFITMIFFTIVLAGLVPLVITSLKASTVDRDITSAQFAAEAGAKRAIATFYQTTQDWSWVDTTSTVNWVTLYNNANEKYHVKITLSGSQVTPSSSASSGTYTITSTGSVNGTAKTINVTVTVSGGGGGSGNGGTLASNITLYAGSISGNVTVNNGTLQCAASIPSGVGGSASKVPNTALILPTYDFAAYKATATAMPTIVSNTNNLTASKYYVDGDWNITAQNANISTNNTIVFVNGNVNINTNVNFNGNITIIATGNITSTTSNLSLSQGVLVSYGNLTVSSLNGFNGAVFIKGSANFQGNAAINWNSSYVSSLNSQMSAYTGSSTPTITVGTWSS